MWFLYIYSLCEIQLRKTGIVLDILFLKPTGLLLKCLFEGCVCVCRGHTSFLLEGFFNYKIRKRKGKKDLLRGQRNAVLTGLELKFVFHLKWQISKSLFSSVASRWIFPSFWVLDTVCLDIFPGKPLCKTSIKAKPS